MSMFRSALILIMISVLGCAGSQPVRLQLPPEARIGILNVLEPEMTHIDVGSLRFDSFTKVYRVNWGIPDYLSHTIESDLRALGSYTFVSLAGNAPQHWKQSMSDSILNAVTGWMSDKLKAFMNRTAEDNRLDLIISVSSYDSGRWPQAACFKIAKDPVATKGYGIYTRSKVLSGLSQLVPVGQNTAIPYADILVAVFQTQPVNLAGYAHAPCSKASLPDFPWKSDIRMLSPEVIRQVRPYVEQLGAEAVRTALSKTGLLP
ncbi:MAG: hypothetical protein P8X90_08715 [Desulfobacterales bacterium]